MKKSKKVLVALALSNIVCLFLGIILFLLAAFVKIIPASAKVYMNLIGQISFIYFFLTTGIINTKKHKYFEGTVLLAGAVVIGFFCFMTFLTIYKVK